MISLFGSNVGQEELDQLRDSFEKQWLGIGPKVAEFERKIAERCGAPGFVLLNSGSNSLHMAIRLLDLPKGSEVVLPSFTWVSCASAVLLNDLVPVFCDVDVETCNVRAQDIEAKITPNTSAVMVVHYAGKPVDMDGIRRLGLPIIEDAAHAIDSTYKDEHCGTLGDVSIFSFDAVKNLTTGEGGGVFAKDARLLDQAKTLRYCGIAKSGFEASAAAARWWEYDIQDAFPKMLPNDVGAAIGLAQLDKLEQFQARRKELWSVYTDALAEGWAADWLDLPPGPEPHERHSYFTYCLRLKRGSRDQLARFLYDRGIYTSLRFHPLHMNAIFGQLDQKLPNSEHLNDVALCIPFHHRLSDEDVATILAGLKDFARECL